MIFNFLNLIKLDHWDDNRMRQVDAEIRPASRMKSVNTEYRPHDRGRGQEINNQWYTQINWKQQKQLYSRNPWVKKCIDHIAAATASLRWQIVAKEEFVDQMETDSHMQYAQRMLCDLFERPNTLDQSFSDLIKMIVRDLKIMDAASIEKIKSPDGRIVGLKAVDASDILIDIDQYGQIIRYIQDLRGTNLNGLYNNYGESLFYKPQGNQYIYFAPDEMIYLQLNPRSESPYGSSPIASLVDAIYADLATDINLYHFLNTGGVNVGFLTIGRDLGNDYVERLRAKFERSLAPGYRYDFPIIAASEEINWTPMQMNNQEAQMAELQKELRNKILAVLSIPPNELGLTGSTRGQVYSQQDVFWGNAVIPMAKTIAEKFTSSVVEKFDNRLKFEFLPPEEYAYEAVIGRILQLDGQGLIDDDYKRRKLGLKKPKFAPYMQKKRDLEIDMLELNKKTQELQWESQDENRELIIQEPALQFNQMLAESRLAMQNAAGSDKQIALQEKQLELQEKQMDMATEQFGPQSDLQKQELDIQKMQLQLQSMQIQAQLQMMQGQEPSTPVSGKELIQGIESGNIDQSKLVSMLESGAVSPDQLKLITTASRAVKTVIDDAINKYDQEGSMIEKQAKHMGAQADMIQSQVDIQSAKGDAQLAPVEHQAKAEKLMYDIQSTRAKHQMQQQQMQQQMQSAQMQSALQQRQNQFQMQQLQRNEQSAAQQQQLQSQQMMLQSQNPMMGAPQQSMMPQQAQGQQQAPQGPQQQGGGSLQQLKQQSQGGQQGNQQQGQEQGQQGQGRFGKAAPSAPSVAQVIQPVGIDTPIQPANSLLNDTTKLGTLDASNLAEGNSVNADKNSGAKEAGKYTIGQRVDRIQGTVRTSDALGGKNYQPATNDSQKASDYNRREVLSILKRQLETTSKNNLNKEPSV